ncbi:MAG: dihydropteridine reductase [Bacilli bacterium]|jgi:hypothetical protein
MLNVEEEELKDEYTPKKKTNLDVARKLDKKAKLPVYILAYTLGIIGALVLGVGMCLAMKVIGDGSNTSLILGIAIGILGIVLVSINYPIFLKYMRKRKEKYASEIILTLNK